MFEEEARERFVKSYPEFCCNGKLLSPYWDLWQDGAEFGYNKANKWHKVADGDLPKETEFIESDVLLLLVQLKGTKHKRYELGRYIFFESVFTYTHLKLVEDVVAWCEIPTFTEE